MAYPPAKAYYIRKMSCFVWWLRLVRRNWFPGHRVVGRSHFMATDLLNYYDITAEYRRPNNNNIRMIRAVSATAAVLLYYYIIHIMIWRVYYYHMYYHHYRHVCRGVRSRVWHATTAETYTTTPLRRAPGLYGPANLFCAIIVLWYVQRLLGIRLRQQQQQRRRRQQQQRVRYIIILLV